MALKWVVLVFLSHTKIYIIHCMPCYMRFSFWELQRCLPHSSRLWQFDFNEEKCIWCYSNSDCLLLRTPRSHTLSYPRPFLFIPPAPSFHSYPSFNPLWVIRWLKRRNRAIFSPYFGKRAYWQIAADIRCSIHMYPQGWACSLPKKKGERCTNYETATTDSRHRFL